LPSDGFAAAAFILHHLYKPVAADGSAEYRAVAETELPLQGDVWFWTDDNAKVLEFISRPELWQRNPVEFAEILRFLRSMCRDPFIFRRVARPRLEAAGDCGDRSIYRHSLMNIGHDLKRGLVTVGIRFHDERSSDVHLTANHVEFTYARRRIRLSVEPSIDETAAVQDGQCLTLRHAGDLYFSGHGRRQQLGRITYTYTFDARSVAIGVEAALELAPNLTVTDVVLTIGHRHLGAWRDAVIAADAPQPGTTLFAARAPTRRSIALAEPSYYQIRQGRISGDAPALHSRTRQPGLLTSIDVVVRRPWLMHSAVTRYTFPGPQSERRLVVAEDKMLTSGGLYRRAADYAEFIREAVQFAQHHAGALDYSIPYDYGSVLNAFAKCFAVCASRPWSDAPTALGRELRALFDRYLDIYFRYYVDEHEQRPDAIFSRELAFVILAVVTAYRVTGSLAYRRRLGRLCDVLLDFEMSCGIRDGHQASAFLMRTHSPEGAPGDCQAASLLALTRAAPLVDDPRLPAAIDRGLWSYHVRTFDGYLNHALRFEAVSTVMAHNYRRRPAALSRLWALRDPLRRREQADPVVWSYKVGLTLRLFAALRACSDGRIQAVVERHRERLDRFEGMLRHLLAKVIVDRGDAIEFLCSPLSAETNSETQPWVMLGLLGHPCD
jgi:hypothetical protein